MDFEKINLPPITLRKVSALKENPGNPRFIRDERFDSLKKQLDEFPQGMQFRPLIVDKKGVVLGGNMRLRAARELGWKKIPTVQAEDLTKKQIERLIIVDNLGFGEWDREMLLKEWELPELRDWGLEIFPQTDIDLDQFFEDDDSMDEDNATRLTLKFKNEDYERVMEALSAYDKTPEKALLKVLFE